MFTCVSLTKLGTLQPLFLQITSQLQSLSPLFLELQASTGLLMSSPLVSEPLLSFVFLSLFFRLDIFSLSSSSLTFLFHLYSALGSLSEFFISDIVFFGSKILICLFFRSPTSPLRILTIQLMCQSLPVWVRSREAVTVPTASPGLAAGIPSLPFPSRVARLPGFR